MSDLIVTLDGPAGTGKSTVSREVASRLGLPRLDTGAFYRAAALAAIRAGVDLADHEAVANVVAGISLDQQDGRMLLDGLDVSVEIRSQAATEASSVVSTHPEVRGLLVVYQREWVARHDNRAVVEGRDIGSVVFPDATVKVYLDARPEVRAQRRADQTGKEHSGVLAELSARDARDSTRQASPLIIPEGAAVIDTSDMTVAEVVDTIVAMAREQAG
ncbi:MAG TPA: (d)CMP kinase [Acidimicrobiia bacterium]|nr:(d)CMP kinase [Acidimicrobiia bacterium]